MRLAFIEAHLAVNGCIAPRDFLDCSPVTASKILSRYRELHPGVLTYSRATRAYTCDVLPTYHLEVDAARFLDAYNVLYRGMDAPVILLLEKYRIVDVEGSLAYILDGRPVPLLHSFRRAWKPEVGGFYCVPFKGRAFYLSIEELKI